MRASFVGIASLPLFLAVMAHAAPLTPVTTATATGTAGPAGLHPTLVTIAKPDAPSAVFQVHRTASAVSQIALEKKTPTIVQVTSADGSKTTTFNATPCSGGGTMSGTLVQRGTVQNAGGGLTGTGNVASTLTYVKCVNGGTTLDGGPFTMDLNAQYTAGATQAQSTQTGSWGFRGNLTTSSASGTMQLSNANVVFTESATANGFTYFGTGQMTINGTTITFNGERVTIGTATMFF